MSLIIATTVSTRNRSITIQLADGTSERLALVRHGDGSVHWRQDVFAVDAEQGTGLQWDRHDGRLAVADVLDRAPQCRRDIERWTQEELDDGPELLELDIFGRDLRARALARLQAELDAVGGS